MGIWELCLFLMSRTSTLYIYLYVKHINIYIYVKTPSGSKCVNNACFRAFKIMYIYIYVYIEKLIRASWSLRDSPRPELPSKPLIGSRPHHQQILRAASCCVRASPRVTPGLCCFHSSHDVVPKRMLLLPQACLFTPSFPKFFVRFR